MAMCIIAMVMAVLRGIMCTKYHSNTLTTHCMLVTVNIA